MRVLLVEDTADLAEAISERLTGDGYVVDWVQDGLKAKNIMAYQEYCLVILDLGLPELSGRRVLAWYRGEGYKTPVLVLTARASIDDRVSTLDLGADDYLVKPVDLRELSARCRVLIRRSAGETSSQTCYGNLILDRAASTIRVEGKALELPKRELTLLQVFLNNPGRVMSKAQLIDQLYTFDEQPGDNAIEVYIARLRKKLSGSDVSIKTLRGIGYIAHVQN